MKRPSPARARLQSPLKLAALLVAATAADHAAHANVCWTHSTLDLTVTSFEVDGVATAPPPGAIYSLVGESDDGGWVQATVLDPDVASASRRMLLRVAQ